MSLRHTPARNGQFFLPALFAFLVAGLLHECVAENQNKGRIPTKDEQATTLKLVREIYHAEYKSAQTSREKSALAQKILKAGVETKDDSVGRYVLIKLARDIAVQAGDVELAMSAVAAMSDFYQVDESNARITTVIDLSMYVSADQTSGLFDQIINLSETAISDDDYDIAAQLVKAGLDAATKSRDSELVSIARKMSAHIEDMSAAFAGIRKSFETLKQKPNDPEANLAVGKFQCLVKADWQKGLPLLAMSGHTALQQLAKAELAGAKDGAAKLQIADRWWKLATSLPESEQIAAKLRAGSFYQEAARELTGLQKAKAASRLSEAEQLGEIAALETGRESAPNAEEPARTEYGSLEIRPSQLQEKKVEYKLPASFYDMAVGGGGRYLIFYFKTLNKLGFFDVNEGRITEYVPLEIADIRFAAGAEAFYIALRSQNVIQRWNLLTFKKGLTVKLPFENPVDVLAVGSAADGPLYAGAMHAPGVFLNPRSLKPLPYTVIDHVYQKSDAEIPGAGPETRVRASANGQAFSLWRTGVSPGGFRTMLLAGKQVHVFYQHDTMGYIAPSPDGELMYTARGVFTNQTKEYSANLENFAKSFPVPAVQGNYSLWVKRDDDQKKTNNPTTSMTVHLNGEAQPILTLPDISMRPGGYGDFHGRELMTLDRRIWFIPQADLIITLPSSNQKVIMHSMNLDKELEDAGIDYLYVTSRPAGAVRKGGSYRYKIDVRSKNGGVTFKLESGPEGMRVTGDGLVTWRVSRRADSGNQDAIVSIKDSSDQEITHAFKIAVE